jgi:uncharacterized LabA/DUF88 family protein
MKQQPNVLFVVDVSNFYYCIRKRFGPEAKLDYSRLISGVLDRDEVLYRAVAYGTEINGNADSFKFFLGKVGFDLKYKEAKEYIQHDGSITRKGNWDGGIIVDIIREIDNFDTLVLGSADSDFCYLLDYLREKRKFTRVIGSQIGRELRDSAHECIEIQSDFLVNFDQDSRNQGPNKIPSSDEAWLNKLQSEISQGK